MRDRIATARSLIASASVPGDSDNIKLAYLAEAKNILGSLRTDLLSAEQAIASIEKEIARPKG